MRRGRGYWAEVSIQVRMDMVIATPLIRNHNHLFCVRSDYIIYFSIADRLYIFVSTKLYITQLYEQVYADKIDFMGLHTLTRLSILQCRMEW